MDDWTVPDWVYVCPQQCPHINSVCIVLGSQVCIPVSAYKCRWYVHLLSARLSSCRDIACRMIYQTQYFVPSAAQLLSSCIRCTSVSIISGTSWLFALIWRCLLVGRTCISSPKYFKYFNFLAACSKRFKCVSIRSKTVTLANAMRHPYNRSAEITAKRRTAVRS